MRNDEWRILVGEDAKALDRMVRESPETAYEQSFMQALQAQGHLRMGGWRSPGRRGGRSAIRGTRVEAFTDSGAFLTAWGSPGNHDGQFNSATALAVAPNGSVWVTDDNPRVQRFACSVPPAQ